MDRIVASFKDSWKRLEVEYDDFIRNSPEPRHQEVVSRFFQKLYDQGDIYKASYEGWYKCSPREAFWGGKQAGARATAPTAGRRGGTAPAR